MYVILNSQKYNLFLEVNSWYIIACSSLPVNALPPLIHIYVVSGF